MNKDRIYRTYLNTAINLNKKILELILNVSKSSIEEELLFSIIVIEKMNRGHFSNYILEKCLSLLAPSILINYNASIGLCQICVKTARKVVNLPEETIVRKLMLPEYNIDIMLKLIELYSYESTSDKSNLRKTIINLHTTGKKNASPNIYLDMYHELVNWSIKNRCFSKIYLSPNYSPT